VKLVADESLDLPIVERLRRDGHDVGYVAEMAPGVSDDKVLALVNQETRLLVTADKDFGELVFRQGRALPGVVLIRLAGLSAGRKADIVASALAAHGQELPGAFTVVTPGAIRIRRRSGKPRSPSG